MALAVRPPVAPMLAKLARALPDEGQYLYEPKWDGFRCLVFRDGDDVELCSRNQRSLARYFPELVSAFRAVPEASFALDGEIVLATATGFDFGALMSRLHPAASRAEKLARDTPAVFVAFDVVAAGDRDLRAVPFETRRSELTRVVPAGAEPRLVVTPCTADRDVAEGWLERFEGGGLDGVVAKRRDLVYQPGARAMVKVKFERTADCVVAGVRLLADEVAVASLLLGLYDTEGDLRHVGVASSFTAARRRELLDDLRPYVTDLRGHVWEHGFALAASPVGRLKGAAGRWTPEMAMDWVPLRPELVCEVAYDHFENERFRHPARFRHWRPDLDARDCTFDQMRPAPLPALDELAAW